MRGFGCAAGFHSLSLRELLRKSANKKYMENIFLSLQGSTWQGWHLPLPLSREPHQNMALGSQLSPWDSGRRHWHC